MEIRYSIGQFLPTSVWARIGLLAALALATVLATIIAGVVLVAGGLLLALATAAAALRASPDRSAAVEPATSGRILEGQYIVIDESDERITQSDADTTNRR